MGPIRQSAAVATIDAVKPESRKQRTTARRWPHWSPRRGTTSAPGPPITSGLASSNWPPGPSKRRGACGPNDRHRPR